MKTSAIIGFLAIIIIIVGGWYAYRHYNARVTQQGIQEQGVGTLPGGAWLIGVWQSTTDAKFVREFRADGTVVDSYDGAPQATDTWKLFTKDNAPQVSFALEAGASYIQITRQGGVPTTFTFKIATLTQDELDLIYLDRGGSLTFKKIR